MDFQYGTNSRIFPLGDAVAHFERHGQDWGDDELVAIVADYFSMLDSEISRTPYVKSHHRAELMKLVRRSPGSIERKHQNVSAVLVELGLPWIWGYKPLPNYQEALFQAIDGELTRRERLGAAIADQPAMVPSPLDPDEIFVPVPEGAVRTPRAGLERLIRKFDPVQRDFRNRQLGRAGEEFVLDLERKRLAAGERSDLARKVRWVAVEDGDGAGFDVLSFDLGGEERLIEVKTTNGAAGTPFFMTRNEMEVARERAGHWHLYRLHLFAQQPRIFTLRPPLERSLTMSPENWLVSPGIGLADAGHRLRTAR